MASPDEGKSSKLERAARLNRPWYVKTLGGNNLTESFDSQDEAERDAFKRNKQASDLGISERYHAVENHKRDHTA
jgi:hypothetical protein